MMISKLENENVRSVDVHWLVDEPIQYSRLGIGSK